MANRIGCLIMSEMQSETVKVSEKRNISMENISDDHDIVVDVAVKLNQIKT